MIWTLFNIMTGTVLFGSAFSTTGWTAFIVGGIGLSMLLTGFIGFMGMIGNLIDHFSQKPANHPDQHDRQP